MTDRRSTLIVRVGSVLCGIPSVAVVETMRPLPVERVAGVPSPVLGLAMIRGRPTPVVALDRMIFDEELRTPTRYVTVKVADRHVALSVDSVVGVRNIPSDSTTSMPPLLGNARPDVLAAVGSLDADLLLMFETVRVIPGDVWAAIDAATS